MRRRPEEIQVQHFPRYGGGLVLASFAHTWYLDTVSGKDGRDGRDHRHPMRTMEEAFERVTATGEPGQVIQMRGTIREELVAPLVPDCTIRGAVPGIYGAGAGWAPPAVPTAVTPLLRLRRPGWRFEGIHFDCPVDAAGVLLDSEVAGGFNASQAAFDMCHFVDGLHGIADDGGTIGTRISRSRFSGLTQAAIELLALDVATPFRWLIEDSDFEANASHILASMQQCRIRRNAFGTVTAAGLYIDLDQLAGTQGANVVGPHNVLGGTYDATDYDANATDVWAGNYTGAGITAANPV